MRDNLLAARIQKIDEEVRTVRERGKKEAERAKAVAGENVEEAVGKLLTTFERELDV